MVEASHGAFGVWAWMLASGGLESKAFRLHTATDKANNLNRCVDARLGYHERPPGFFGNTELVISLSCAIADASILPLFLDDTVIP